LPNELKDNLIFLSWVIKKYLIYRGGHPEKTKKIRGERVVAKIRNGLY